MNRNLRRRSIVIGVVTLLALILLAGPWNKGKDGGVSAADFFSPSRLMQNLSENIRLGLDLKGGTHLVMQVQADEAIKGITEGNRQRAVETLNKNGIKFTDVKTPAGGQVVVETPDAAQHSEIKDKLLADFGPSDWAATTRGAPAAVIFDLQRAAAKRIRREATIQAKTIIQQRIDAFGVAEKSRCTSCRSPLDGALRMFPHRGGKFLAFHRKDAVPFPQKRPSSPGTSVALSFCWRNAHWTASFKREAQVTSRLCWASPP